MQNWKISSCSSEVTLPSRRSFLIILTAVDHSLFSMQELNRELGMWELNVVSASEQNKNKNC